MVEILLTLLIACLKFSTKAVMHIRDKSLIDLIKDLGHLKPAELWGLRGAVIALTVGIFTLGYKIGAMEVGLEAALCKLALERRSHLLSDVERQLDPDSQERIRVELTAKKE